MASTEPGADLTYDVILHLNDIIDAYEWLEKLTISADYLDTLEDAKERLMLYLENQSNNNTPVKEPNNIMRAIQENDKKRRQALRALYQKGLDANAAEFEDLGLHHILEVEGTCSSNFVNEMAQRITYLGNDTCPILVAGETGAGKSTFINLLLGENILPESALSCTAGICKLRYGQKRAAKITYVSGDVREISFTACGDPIAELHSVIYPKEKRDEGAPFKSVEIYLPADILKSGIILIDTPGIGENEAMNNVVKSFVDENEILGFIYVIKSDNAGGVQESRLLRLLKMIIEKEDSTDDDASLLVKFSPKCAMFVCNRWDVIEKPDRDIVRNHVLSKLGSCWPQFKPEQVYYMSSMKSWGHYKACGYICHDFCAVLTGLEKLIPVCLDMRVDQHYRWLSHVVIRILHHLESLFVGLDKSQRHVDKECEKLRSGLDALQSKTDKTLNRLHSKLIATSASISYRLKVYLQTDEAYQHMINLARTDNLSSATHVHDALSTQINGLFLKWEEKHGDFSKIQDMLITDLKVDLQILESDLGDIEQQLQNENTPNYSLSSSFVQARHFSRVDLAPMSKLSLLLKPLIFAKDRWQLIRDDVLFASNQSNFIKTSAKRMLKKATQKGILDTFITSQMLKFKSYLTCVESNIPKLIQSNRELMERVMKSGALCQLKKSSYRELRGVLDALRRDLAEFHISTRKLSTSTVVKVPLHRARAPTIVRMKQIVILKSKSCVEISRQPTQGLWTVVRSAYYEDKGDNSPLPGVSPGNNGISIRTYLPSVDYKGIFNEVVKIRRLHHPCLAEFLGIMHANSPMPAFIFQEHLFPMRNIIFRPVTGSQPVNSVGENALLEIVTGLEYIHKQRLVHMELSLDTIMVTWNNAVKLSGMCYPRKASFPLSKNTIMAADFVYLSPEVLAGEIYGPEADMYGVGLVAWEMLTKQLAFEEERKWFLSRVIEGLDPTPLLTSSEYGSKVNSFYKHLIERCIQLSPFVRYTATQCLKDLHARLACDNIVFI